MSGKSDSLINEVLKKLDEWRHFPSYKLEPRLDIFISICLPDIVRELIKKPNLIDADLEVIPEFPLHKETVLKSGGNRSNKVDFAVFRKCKARKQIFLIELKTDDNSIDRTQLCVMKKARNVGARALLVGVKKCAENTNVQLRPKYTFLLKKLVNLGYFNYSGNFEEDVKQSSWKKTLTKLTVWDGCNQNKTSENESIICALIYPGHGEDTQSKLCKYLEKDKRFMCLRFNDLVGILEKHDKQLGEKVAIWGKNEAGSM